MKFKLKSYCIYTEISPEKIFFFCIEDFNFLLARRLLSFSFYCEFFSYYSSQLNEGHDGTDPSAPHSFHCHGHHVGCILYYADEQPPRTLLSF